MNIRVDNNTPPPFVDNIICDNTIYNIENVDNTPKDFTSTCWCTTDEAVIKEKIFDGFDDASLGLISYEVNGDCEITVSNENFHHSDHQNIIAAPNPFSSILKLKFDTVLNKAQVLVYSLEGKKVFENEYFNQSTLNLKLEELSHGLYLINVVTDTNVISKMVLKQ